MSTTTVATDWRGVAADNGDDIPPKVGLLLKARSRRLLGELVKPYRRELTVCGAMVVVQTAFNMAGPYLVSVGIDHGIPSLRAGDWTPIILIFAGMAVSAALAAALRAVFLNKVGRIGQTMLLDLRRLVFAKFQSLPLAFHENYTSGRVISRLTSDPDSLNDLIDNGLDGLLDALLTVAAVGIMMAVLDVPLALVVAVAFPFMLLLMRWFSRRSAIAYRKTREAIAALIVHFVETCNGIRAVKAFRREPRNNEIFAELNDDFRVGQRAGDEPAGGLHPRDEAVASAATAAVLVFGGYRVMDGNTPDRRARRLHAVPAASSSTRWRTSRCSTTPSSPRPRLWRSCPECWRRSLDAGRAAAPDAAAAAGRRRMEFQDVRFAYPKRESDRSSASGETLREASDFTGESSGEASGDVDTGGKVILPLLDLAVPAGQTVALVGATGAGKSTLARLMCRFYDPRTARCGSTAWTCATCPTADLRRAVVMVTQENFLFCGSSRTTSRSASRPPPMRRWSAAARAIGAHEFIERLPEGYAPT